MPNLTFTTCCSLEANARVATYLTVLVVSYQYTPPGFLIAVFRYGICNLGLVDVGSLLRKRWALLGQKSQIEAIKS